MIPTSDSDRSSRSTLTRANSGPGGDEAAAEEALGEGDAAEGRPTAHRADRFTGGVGDRLGRGRGAEAPVGQGADGADEAGERHRRRPTDLVGEEPTDQGGERGRGHAARAEESDDPTTHPGRIGRAPQAELERRAERDADPEGERHHDDDERRRDDEEHQQRPGSGAPEQRELASRLRPDPAGEDAQQVGQERGRRQHRQAERLEPAPPGDRRQQRRDQGAGHADADRGDQVERQVARDRAQALDRIARRQSHQGTSDQPSGLRGELTGSAMGSPSRWTRDAPRKGGSPVLGQRFGRRRS